MNLPKNYEHEQSQVMNAKKHVVRQSQKSQSTSFTACLLRQTSEVNKQTWSPTLLLTNSTTRVSHPIPLPPSPKPPKKHPKGPETPDPRPIQALTVNGSEVLVAFQLLSTETSHTLDTNRLLNTTSLWTIPGSVVVDLTLHPHLIAAQLQEGLRCLCSFSHISSLSLRCGRMLMVCGDGGRAAVDSTSRRTTRFWSSVVGSVDSS